jgi:hypothetical protein
MDHYMVHCCFPDRSRREPHSRLQGGTLRHTLMSAVLIGATLVNCLGIRATHADECVDAPVIFDGIQPLTYKRVKGGPEDRAYIFSHYGARCQPGETNQCKARFVISGDIVAVAKTCGDFAYIQYIGEKTITTGWTQAKSLESWRPVSADEKPTVFGGPDAAEGHERFKLLQGNGVPVCEAYLQRLNRTEFGAPSYCGRPESTQVPGFDKLNRVYLTTKEVNEISDTGIPERFNLSTWQYQPPIDADNDGHPDNVLVWNLDSPKEPHCGLNSGGPAGLDTGFQLAVILAADNRTVDPKNTLEIFGSNNLATAEKIDIFSQAKTSIHDFPAYGRSYSLFRYHGVTYFDTYIGHEPDRVTGDIEPSQLRVFLRRDHHTSAICTLR